VRAAGELSDGAEASIALPPTGTGWVVGYADADADALRADDRRYFAYRSRRAPTVAVAGDPGLFVAQALEVLRRSGRVTEAPVRSAELLVAMEGVGLEARAEGTSTLIVPPADATLLPALNRRLTEAAIPWRFDLRGTVGEGALEGSALPEALEGVRVADWYLVEPASASVAPTSIVATVADARWALEATDATGRRLLLLASPLSADATTLPVSTGMVRFVDWVATEWAGAGGVGERVVGDHLTAPPGATRVRFPSGREEDVDGTGVVRRTGEAGPYTFLEGDSVVSVVALNPPAAESRLDRLDEDDVEGAIGSEVTLVSDARDWAGEAYRARRGPEVWWPLLFMAALLLMAESAIASSGRAGQSTAQRRTAVAA
jgi:hypothetical protein